MNQENFIYWLQGMLEYTDVDSLSQAVATDKLQGIKDHLELVMTKVTPVLHNKAPIFSAFPEDKHEPKKVVAPAPNSPFYSDQDRNKPLPYNPAIAGLWPLPNSSPEDTQKYWLEYYKTRPMPKYPVDHDLSHLTLTC
jgi:hypothetical protein